MQGKMMPKSGMSLASVGLALALCAGGLESVHADWTVINLHPTGMVNSEAHAIHGSQQVGVTGTSQGALLWTGSASSVVKLDGTSAVATAEAVYGGRQGGSLSVGTGINRRTHAAIWSGTQASMVDLHPGAEVAVHSMIVGMDGTQQVGSFLSAAGGGGGGTFSTGSPCMWSGTAGSFVNLTPAGYMTGEARGCFGGQQVGATFDTGLGTACMWYGSAESFVNLQPAEALFSAAQCTDGVHQYGVIGILEPITGLFPVRWSGSAESWELLGVPDPDTQWGEVHGCFNGYAVGYITDNDGISNSRACVWSDGPDSYADLQQYLPSPLNESNALGVWRHEASGTTYVVGWALNTSSNQRRAVMWVDSQGTNLIVSPSAPASDASVGQSMVYNVHIVNAGPVASGAVTLTVDLPAPWLATFASATPAPSSTTSGRVTFTLPSLAGSGGAADVSITLTAAGGGAATIVAAANGTSEVDPTNNTASASSRITGPAPCVADMGMQGGLPGHDGQLDNNDFIAFISNFFNANTAADVGRQGGLVGPDGAFDNNDFIAFISLFFAGCP